jgi:hypothetical protein
MGWSHRQETSYDGARKAIDWPAGKVVWGGIEDGWRICTRDGKLSTVEMCDMIYGSNLYEGRKAKRVGSQDTDTGTDGVADEPTSAQ